MQPKPFCRGTPVKWEAKATHWFLFLGVLLLCLVLARNLFEAYQRQYARGDGKPAEKLVISYGQWLTLLVYAAILIPASYLAAGSLVLLQTRAPEPPPSLSAALDSLNATQTDPLTLAVASQSEKLGAEGAPYRHQALRMASFIDSIAVEELYRTRLQQSDTAYGDRLVALQAWRRIQRRQIADQLSVCTSALQKAAAPAEVAPPPPPPAEVGADAENAPTLAPTVTPPPDPIGEACQNFNGISLLAPAPEGETGNQGLVDKLYPWLGSDRNSRPILLMMGLLGFGLFGAAIRAMGSRTNLIDEVNHAQSTTRLNATSFGAIIVNGAGAAMAVFLAFQAGALVFTGDANGSPFPQLLFCFLGAVFANEVWEWGGRTLSSLLRQAGIGAEGTWGTDALRRRLDGAKAIGEGATKAREVRVAAGGDPAALIRLAGDLDAKVTDAEGRLEAADAAWRSQQQNPGPSSAQTWTDRIGPAEQAVVRAEAAAQVLKAEIEKATANGGGTQPAGEPMPEPG